MNNFERDDSNAIICPYCGARDDDAWEKRNESGIIKCWQDDCGKSFHWERRVTVDYITKADCKINNEVHDFSEEHSWIKDSKDNRQEFCVCDCKKCAEYIIKRREVTK